MRRIDRMIVGTGIDIVEIDRIAALIDHFGGRFVSRIFSADEIAYANSHAHPTIHLAARFAAKEACVKAIPGISIGKVSVITGKRGQPYVKAIEGIDRSLTISLSLSHTRRYAVAVVIVERLDDCASSP